MTLLQAHVFQFHFTQVYIYETCKRTILHRKAEANLMQLHKIETLLYFPRDTFKARQIYLEFA